MTLSTLISRLLNELVTLLFLTPIQYLPGALGYRLRAVYWKTQLKHLGKNVTIDPGVHISGAGYISIGDNAWIDKNVILVAGPPYGSRITHHKPNPAYTGKPGELVIGAKTHICPNVVISAHGGVTIGDEVGVAMGSAIYSLSHHYRDLTDAQNGRRDFAFSPRAAQSDQAMIQGPIVLQDRSAVGIGCVLMPGVTLGRGAWLAALTLARQDVPPGMIASAENGSQKLSFKPR